MNHDSLCLLERGFECDAPTPGLVCFEIFTGEPITNYEQHLNVSICYFVAETYAYGGGINRHATRTLHELADIYIDLSRRVVNHILDPYSVRNLQKEDADSHFRPLNSSELDEFKKILWSMDADRYRKSFSD